MENTNTNTVTLTAEHLINIVNFVYCCNDSVIASIVLEDIIKALSHNRSYTMRRCVDDDENDDLNQHIEVAYEMVKHDIIDQFTVSKVDDTWCITYRFYSKTN